MNELLKSFLNSWECNAMLYYYYCCLSQSPQHKMGRRDCGSSHSHPSPTHGLSIGRKHMPRWFPLCHVFCRLVFLMIMSLYNEFCVLSIMQNECFKQRLMVKPKEQGDRGLNLQSTLLSLRGPGGGNEAENCSTCVAAGVLCWTEICSLIHSEAILIFLPSVG